jgi:hypothetical protein
MVKARSTAVNRKALPAVLKFPGALRGHVGPVMREHLESVEMVSGIHMAAVAAVADITVEAAP